MAKEEVVHMGDEDIEYDSDCMALGHDDETDFEDDNVWQGHCRRCGAELFEDKK